ncbi:MAG: hypothetical protein FJ125_00100 [Deltaproteobacteria bacterium]|nr:hypothetical protein [Deltaproteobacteria bacterium]
MAIISPGELTFIQLVGQYFLAQKGRGLQLSAADLALVRSWEEQGAPARVVCAGIKEAFEAYRRVHGPEARTPGSLAYCRKAVERALRSWREARVGNRDDER